MMRGLLGVKEDSLVKLGDSGFYVELRWLDEDIYRSGSPYLRESLGFTYVKVRVSNPLKAERFREIELLVDSGAVFTSLPRKVLEELGLSPIDREKLRAYGGAVIERDVGWALVEYDGKRRVVPVLFGEEEDIPILGATSLEALGYQLDPVTKKLKPVELLMM